MNQKVKKIFITFVLFLCNVPLMVFQQLRKPYNLVSLRNNQKNLKRMYHLEGERSFGPTGNCFHQVRQRRKNTTKNRQ